MHKRLSVGIGCMVCTTYSDSGTRCADVRRHQENQYKNAMYCFFTTRLIKKRQRRNETTSSLDYSRESFLDAMIDVARRVSFFHGIYVTLILCTNTVVL